MSLSCIFCDQSRFRPEYETSTAMIVRDINPVSPGHTLIIPKRHVQSYFDLIPGERKQLDILLDRAHRSLVAEFKPAGFNVGINDGADAGQTVPHVHIHLIPRYAGDVVDPRGGIRGVIPGKAIY